VPRAWQPNQFGATRPSNRLTSYIHQAAGTALGNPESIQQNYNVSNDNLVEEQLRGAQHADDLLEVVAFAFHGASPGR